MDIYAAVTDRIIAQMEQGVIPWQKPWVSNGKAVSHATGKPYSLLNQMLLGRPGEYLTFKQCQDAGGKVKKGEKAQLVVFWKWNLPARCSLKCGWCWKGRSLFEDELCPVYKLIRESGECTAMLAFDDIGTALYLLKQHIIQLQEVHHRKAQRQTDTQKPIELQ